MTYFVYDSRGYVGDLASTRGLSDLMKYLRTLGEASRELYLTGATTKLETLAKELDGAKTKNPYVASSITTLKNLIPKCQDVLIITAGVF